MQAIFVLMIVISSLIFCIGFSLIGYGVMRYSSKEVELEEEEKRSRT